MTRESPIAIRAVLALVVVAGCGPSVVADEAGNDGDADTSASSSATTTPTTADDGPGTSPTTSPSTTANPTGPTSMSDTSPTDPSDDSNDDTIDTEGCAFLDGCGFDVGDGLIECDVWAQDCPIGEKCMPWANDGGERWNATRCSPLDAAPNSVGEPCAVEGPGLTGIDDCGIHEMCWDVDPDTNEGTCVAMCGGSEAFPDCGVAPGTQCLIAYDHTITLCLPPCDPSLQDCSANATCVPVAVALFCVPDQSGAEGQYGDGCDSIDSCDPGLFCGHPELVPGCVDDTCCAEYCDLSVPDPDTQCTDNAMGVQCVPWAEAFQDPPGPESLGVCGLPS
jgi:hypothetical protein